MNQIRNTTLSVAVSGAGNDDPVYAPPPGNPLAIHVPSGDEIARALKEQRGREAGGTDRESAVAAMAPDGDAPGASPFASLGEPAIARTVNLKQDGPSVAEREAAESHPSRFPQERYEREGGAATTRDPKATQTGAVPEPASLFGDIGRIIKDLGKDVTTSGAVTPEAARPRDVDEPLTAGRDPRAGMLASVAQVGAASIVSTMDPREAMLDSPGQVDEPRGGARRPNPPPPRGAMMSSGGREWQETPQVPRDDIEKVERALHQKWVDAVTATPAEIDDPRAAAGLNDSNTPRGELPADVDAPGLFARKPRQIPHA